MSKFKNKFFVVILVFGLFCSAFLFSSCNWDSDYKIINYSDNNSDPINTIFTFTQIQQKIDLAKSKIDNAIFNSNVYLNTTQTITDYFFDGENKEKESTQATNIKILSFNGAYEKTFDEEENQLAEYWYVPNIPTLTNTEEENAILACKSYLQYYKNTSGTKINYYGPLTIKQAWVLTADNAYSEYNASGGLNTSNDTLYSGFLNEQINEFFPCFDIEFIASNLARMSMQQLSDNSCIIIIDYNQYEYEEGLGVSNEVLSGIESCTYKFHLDSFGKLFKSEFSIISQTADGKCMSVVDYVTNVNYNYSTIPSLQKEKWN